MSKNFKRFYSLEVLTRDNRIYTIEGLNIVFNITRSDISVPNLAEIDIYNCNDEYSDVLTKRYNKISLIAGYEGSSGVIFRGDIMNATTPTLDADKVVRVYAKDGGRSWLNARFNRSFSENVNIKTVIKQVIDSLNLPVGELAGLPSGAINLRGQTIVGSSYEILNKMANQYNFDWSIQDGKVTTKQKGGSISTLGNFLISNTTGMIDNPVITEVGVNVTTLLNYEMIPGRRFTLESGAATNTQGDLTQRISNVRTNANGNYVCKKVEHKGGWYDGDWQTYITGYRI